MSARSTASSPRPAPKPCGPSEMRRRRAERQAQSMDKPGRHRTGLNPNFRILTGMSEHPCRDRIGVRGAHAPPEPMPLLVHDADRRRLLRHVQSDIVRHPNLRWCKPPDDNRPDRGTIDGSRPFRDYPRSTHPEIINPLMELQTHGIGGKDPA